ncbi:MAG: hypothetical protein PV340_02270 [Wolbachia sp.]|nr:hypothetical protein [Wolbachia sp.]MDD9336579.1 hypothetical protein [Wolbachia sp.]
MFCVAIAFDLPLSRGVGICLLSTLAFTNFAFFCYSLYQLQPAKSGGKKNVCEADYEF